MALMIPAFTDEQVSKICQIAVKSKIANYTWEDRGDAPHGYMQGMALAFAQCYVKWQKGDPAMILCAKANSHNADIDALSWYAGFFNDLGLMNERDGIDTLRHLFVLLLGLGMRESGGVYCTGRDMSASNTSSDTAEAGLFQTSWNIRSCSSEIQKIMDVWELCLSEDSLPQCYIDSFSDDGHVTCSSSDWSDYGSGAGKDYQEMSKICPPFHTEVTAIGLRKLRQHWGPINRYEVEVKTDADLMFQDVQDYVDTWGEPVPPEPVVATVTVTIDPPGSAKVVVVGSAGSSELS